MTVYDSHYISGTWHKAQNPAVLEVHDSTTEEVMATVPKARQKKPLKRCWRRVRLFRLGRR